MARSIRKSVAIAAGQLPQRRFVATDGLLHECFIFVRIAGHASSLIEEVLTSSLSALRGQSSLEKMD